MCIRDRGKNQLNFGTDPLNIYYILQVESIIEKVDSIDVSYFVFNPGW